jgi:phytoene dehydrogenase-like protein
MDSSYDGIVLGTGHNALVLQAYLCRSGLRVLSVDRAPVAGGAQRTLENPRHPGFLHNTHAFFHRGLDAMPWYRDLELARHGARYLEPDRNAVVLLDDGRALEWWRSLDRTVESVARFSRRDADALRRWVEELGPIVERALIPEAQSPPLPPTERRRLLGRSARGRRLLEVSALSPIEWVERELENEAVRAGLLFFNGLREVDPRLGGFGHAIPALLAGRGAQMAIGGSKRLADALVADIREHGGELRLDAEPRAILVRRGRAAGIELQSGERIAASAFVASGLNPQQTFLELLEADALPRETLERAEHYRYNRLAPLFALNVALHEPPRYGLAGEEGAPPFLVVLGLDGLSRFREVIDAHERNEMPPLIAWGACPTLFDPSQAPPGKHTAFLWEKVPYALRGDPRSWEREAEAHGRELLAFWSRRAPNLPGALIDSFTLTPLETERSFPNMRGGDLLVGSLGHGQVGYHRPFPGAGSYRGVIDRLYLCGSCTHPGGNTTGLCGYNAASVVAADLGLERWWNPPDVREAWRAL